jgi:hypothetical protein
MTPIAETAAEFLRERGNWLRVETVDRPGGGWDLVLRLDGNYSSSVNGWKAELGRHFQERLLEVFRTEGIHLGCCTTGRFLWSVSCAARPGRAITRPDHDRRLEFEAAAASLRPRSYEHPSCSAAGHRLPKSAPVSER